MRRRGLVPVLITTLAAAVLSSRDAEAQISPGELARAHASLEGTAGCAKCHDPSRGVSAERCLTCHTALKQRIDSGRGLHARPEYRKCETCHIDHQGRDADLRWWGSKGLAGFSHSDTGYALEGRHQSLACGACHNPGRVLDPEALSRGGGSPARTYLGLGTSCASCHEDIHRGQVAGKDCLACHTMDSFKSAARFDHSRTKYPLAGRHAALACEKCHVPSGSGLKPARIFAGVKFASCLNCHQDVHGGRLGKECASCHTVAGWSAISKLSSFDHSRTAYPLTGRHRALACDQCHKGSLIADLKHDRCSDCHADPHRGEFKNRPDQGGCESCHDVLGFRDARFSLDDHQRSAYPLEGAHRAVPCDGCHRRNANQKTPVYRLPHDKCLDCHKDAHAGAMDRHAAGKGCLACHRLDSWRAGSFDHAATRFPLTLCHAKVACASCHVSLKTRAPGQALSFTGLAVACASCHRDVHAGQFAREGETSCERCHEGSAWIPAPGFNHNRDSAYPLDGAHSRAPCASCHRVETRDGVKLTRYKPLGMSCSDCHAGRKT